MLRYVLLICVILFLPMNALAETTHFFASTKILNISDDLPKASYARSFQGQGYELAQGDYQSFEKWYERKAPSLYIEGMTFLRSDFAFDWGFGSGESGEKYTIYPSLKLGFRYLFDISEHSDFIISGHHVFGGGFRERSCEADYGDIGGQQAVNCRLAAKDIAPQDTLKYMVHDFSREWAIGFEYRLRF